MRRTNKKRYHYKRYQQDRAVSKRLRLMQEFGKQQGTLYEPHLAKLEVSTGYLRDGNVRHFVSVKPRRHYQRKQYKKETRNEISNQVDDLCV